MLVKFVKCSIPVMFEILLPLRDKDVIPSITSLSIMMFGVISYKQLFSVMLPEPTLSTTALHILTSLKLIVVGAPSAKVLLANNRPPPHDGDG